MKFGVSQFKRRKVNTLGFPPCHYPDLGMSPVCDVSFYIAQAHMMGVWLKFHSATILTVYYGKNILLQTSYFYFAVLIFCVNCHHSQTD